MKRIIAGIVACVMILSGCSNPLVENDSITSTFVIVETGPYWLVVYHKDTKVMYAVSNYSYNYGTFTLLVNSDGTPMTWED